VYSGYLELVVNDVERARAEVIDAAASAELCRGDHRGVRRAPVPADRFEAVMDELAGYASSALGP